ncbi:hypothetical protein LWI29_030833 [Acer saccharum]|uniref:LYR motif-containing protein 2 n=1 Tax=Acer saccharum TaxID=4024 RepID=A0AA39RSJ8_ACESA|nr:hypothetical protein LWI29_030833 [Acer saccharum]
MRLQIYIQQLKRCRITHSTFRFKIPKICINTGPFTGNPNINYFLLDLSYRIYICCREESVMVLSFDLQGFILRARVLKLYRQALRTSRRAPPQARGELNQTIRQEMEKNRDCIDKQKIRFLISEGLERLKGLDEMLDMQGCGQ